MRQKGNFRWGDFAAGFFLSAAWVAAAVVVLTVVVLRVVGVEGAHALIILAFFYAASVAQSYALWWLFRWLETRND